MWRWSAHGRHDRAIMAELRAFSALPKPSALTVSRDETSRSPEGRGPGFLVTQETDHAMPMPRNRLSDGRIASRVLRTSQQLAPFTSGRGVLLRPQRDRPRRRLRSPRLPSARFLLPPADGTRSEIVHPAPAYPDRLRPVGPRGPTLTERGPCPSLRAPGGYPGRESLVGIRWMDHDGSVLNEVRTRVPARIP